MTDKIKNIILIGMMGAGKSCIAQKLLLHFFDFSLVDIDLEIEKTENLSINQIFENFGENHFRLLETMLIKEYAGSEKYIIATGGGSFENEFNQKILSENGIVFYLKAEANTLFERIKNQKDRPLLNCENPSETLNFLLQKREKNYLKADFVIQTDNKSTDEIVKEIVEIYEQNR